MDPVCNIWIFNSSYQEPRPLDRILAGYLVLALYIECGAIPCDGRSYMSCQFRCRAKNSPDDAATDRWSERVTWWQYLPTRVPTGLSEVGAVGRVSPGPHGFSLDTCFWLVVDRFRNLKALVIWPVLWGRIRGMTSVGIPAMW